MSYFKLDKRPSPDDKKGGGHGEERGNYSNEK